MAAAPDPIRRRKLSDDVQERLLQLIRSGGLSPGDVLPSERQLMVDYGVGRPAVREAMQSLQRMGLVDIRHGERPRVAEPSIDAMVGQLSETMHHLLVHSESSKRHLRDARASFESQMARTAAERRTPKDVERLRAILEEQRLCKPDSERFLERDGEFHQAIAAIGGNPILTSLSITLFRWLATFHVDMVRKLGVEDLTLAEHAEIVAAIEAGDTDAAARSMADHLNRVNDLYREARADPAER